MAWVDMVLECLLCEAGKVSSDIKLESLAIVLKRLFIGTVSTGRVDDREIRFCFSAKSGWNDRLIEGRGVTFPNESTTSLSMPQQCQGICPRGPVPSQTVTL